MSSADKTKLDGIASGAEVNVNADWNASSGDAQILNKPTLGTAAAAATTDFASASHTHAASAITSGTLDVARLPVGTGSTQVAAGNHTHLVADVTGAAASGSITASGLTQATARILGRTTASTGSIEEIQIGSGLSLSAGELSSTVSAGIPATILDAKGDLIVGSADNTAARLAVGVTNGHVLTVDSAEATGMAWKAASGGVSAVDATTADVFSVSGSNLVADDGGLIDSANPFVQWNDTSGKLVYANPLSRPSGAMYVGVPPTTTALGTRAINIQADRSLSAARIAGGTDAVMIGNNGEATATSATAIGFRARATGTYALAIGGEPSATANYSVAIGEAAAASAVSAINISNYSAYFGNNSSGVNSVGLNASPSLRAEFATAAMRAVYWGGQTTSDTANVELNLDATATNRMVIAANTAVIADIFLIARRTDNTKFLSARRWVAIRRDGSNNTALIGAVQTIGTDQSEGSPTWTFTIDADDTASVESLRVRVTGAASETVNWRVCAIYRVVA
jgi:hypothetical protein